MYAYNMDSQQHNHVKNILDEVRDVMRLHHYSIHTERAYCDWIRRFALRRPRAFSPADVTRHGKPSEPPDADPQVRWCGLAGS